MLGNDYFDVEYTFTIRSIKVMLNNTFDVWIDEKASACGNQFKGGWI